MKSKAKILKIIPIVLVINILTLSFCGCNKINIYQNDNSLQKVLEKGTLVLGLDNAFPPLGFVDESGESVGFDIDVAREVCNRLGIELVLQTIDWDTKEKFLIDGTIDCIWNGLSITPSRSVTMCLSEPYMKNGLIFIVPGDSDIMGTKDLNGKHIGVQSGSTGEEALQASDIYSNVTTLFFSTAAEVFEALKDGMLDAALVDSVASYYFIFFSDETFFILPDSLDEEEYAIGFRKQDQKLCDKVWETVLQMKIDGTLGEISKKWFGSDITIVK